jgi:hypothetical protein
MFLVENDRAFLDRADRQRVEELFELERREPGDILKAPQPSGARCSNSMHQRILADGLVREQNNARETRFGRPTWLYM